MSTSSNSDILGKEVESWIFEYALREENRILFHKIPNKYVDHTMM